MSMFALSKFIRSNRSWVQFRLIPTISNPQFPSELQDMVVTLSWWVKMRQPSLCHPPCPPPRLKFHEADTGSEPRANRRKVMLIGVLRTCRDMPSETDGITKTDTQSHFMFFFKCFHLMCYFYEFTSGLAAGLDIVLWFLSHWSNTQFVNLSLTNLGHDDWGSHTFSFQPICQLGGVDGGGKEFAITKGQQVKLIDRVLRLPSRCRLSKQRLRKLQGSLHNCTLLIKRRKKQHSE